MVHVEFHATEKPSSMLCDVQVPMIPLTDIICSLAQDEFGLKVTDAAAVYGTPEDIVAVCGAAGFKDVQV